MARKPKAGAEQVVLGRKACGNCYLFERFPDAVQMAGEDIAGECMLNPPTVHGFDEEEAPIQSLPVVFFRDRCGQHQPQEH